MKHIYVIHRCITYIFFQINDTDMVPRMSIPNLWVLDKILGKIKETLKTKQILPTNMECARAFSKQISTTDGDNLSRLCETEKFPSRPLVIQALIK